MIPRMMTRDTDGFAAGEQVWLARLGTLRNAVRQELIGRQLDRYVVDGSRVLDVGCGQGTQALRLARRGCVVTAVDPSPALLARFTADACAAGVDVELHRGGIDELDALLGSRRFDLVCAHGVLMYLADPYDALMNLADRVDPGGLLSVTFRNVEALAFRPGLRRQWPAALEAFDARTYVNELGVTARAERVEDVAAALTASGLTVLGWHGVRVFTDPAPTDEPAPDTDEFDQLIEAELLAGDRDPYRRLAAQIHLVARRSET